MEVTKEDSRQSVEPQFLLQAQASGVKLRIGQMNKAEHEGVIRDIGRYEINLEENGGLVTLLKQEISSITAPHPVFTAVAQQQAANPAEQASSDTAPGRPNIQQEFLDKAIRENQFLTLYLMNGLRVRGTLEAYDSYTLLMKENGKQHLLYKHAVTTINR